MKIRLGKLLRRVYELGRSLFECSCVADDNQYIAELQMHFRGSHYLETPTLQPRDRYAVRRLKSKLAHSLAEHGFIRHDYPFEGNVTGRLHQIFVAAESNDALEALKMRCRTHRQERVASMNYRCAGGDVHLRLAASLQAGHGDLGFMQAGDLVDPQAVQIGIVDLKICPLDWLATRALRFPRIVPPLGSHQYEKEIEQRSC
jgi:hypothetical protein